MTSSFDADELFGTAPPPPSGASMPPKPPQGIEARREVRVSVKWQARVLQPDGSVVAVRVRDISESGIGLAGEHPIRPHAVLRIAVAVPDPHTPGVFSTVTGRFKTAHVTVSGAELLYGGIWVSIDGDGNELLKSRLRKLR